MSKHGKKQAGREAAGGGKAAERRQNSVGRVAAGAAREAGEETAGGRGWPAWCVLGLVFLVVIAARLPFMNNPLVGEETYFAYMAVPNGRDPAPPDHKFLYQARVRGKMHFNAAEHPVPPYLFITKILRPLGGGGAGFAALSFDQKSRAGRTPFFATFCVAAGLLIILAGINLRGAGSWAVALCGGVLLFGLTTPLLVGGSIQPQVDGSIGVLAVALAALGLEGASRRNGGRVWSSALGALAGLAACLGKNEWAMALAGAAVGAWGLAYLMRNAERGMRNEEYNYTKNHKEHTKDHEEESQRSKGWHASAHSSSLAPRPSPLILGILLGLAAGSLCSYLLDPYNYTHGFDVMRRTQAATAARWGDTFRARLPWIWPALFLGVGALAAAAAGWRELFTRHLGRAVLLGWSLALLAGFLASSWPGDFFPRYFCTPMFGLLCFLAVWLPRVRVPAPLAGVLVLALLAGAGANAARLHQIRSEQTALGSSPGKALDAHVRMLEATAREAAAEGQPLRTDLNFGYYYPALDFIANVVTAEQEAAYLRP